MVRLCPKTFCAEKKASFVGKDPLASSHRENGLKLADLDIHGGAAQRERSWKFGENPRAA
jgi:hypothetical protein